MSGTESCDSELTADDLVRGWQRVGVETGMALIVHSSLSSLGRVEGGAAAVVDSLRGAVGSTGTVVVPTFTRQVADPDPACLGVPDADVRARRADVPVFQHDLPSGTGAIPEALRVLPEAVRSRHPQVSVAAVGARAADIVAGQSLGFATGGESPFARLHQLGGYVLLIGVGHNRNTFLHHAEALTPRPRLKLRRFPRNIDGERVWVEALDVADDNDTHFPTVGREFEQHAGIRPVVVGTASCRLVPVRSFVEFAVLRLTELLNADTASTLPTGSRDR